MAIISPHVNYEELGHLELHVSDRTCVSFWLLRDRNELLSGWELTLHWESGVLETTTNC